MVARPLRLALLLGLGSLTGCGADEPNDPHAALIADPTYSDEQAVQQMAASLRSRRGFDHAPLATVTTDREGRPLVTIRFNPDMSDSSTQIVPVQPGETWTPERERGMDLVGLNMALSQGDIGALARVGVARNLQEIAIVIEKTLATDEGDQKLEMLRATISGPQLAALATKAGLLSFTDLEIESHWTVEFDHYDQMTFTTGE